MNIESDRMKLAADAAETLLKALANRNRLLILCRLAEGEHAVGDLAAFLGLRASTVSQHLALLRQDGLVATRRDAQTVWYSIASEPAARVMETLYRTYCAPQDVCHPAPKRMSKKRQRP